MSTLTYSCDYPGCDEQVGVSSVATGVELRRLGWSWDGGGYGRGFGPAPDDKTFCATHRLTVEEYEELFTR